MVGFMRAPSSLLPTLPRRRVRVNGGDVASEQRFGRVAHEMRLDHGVSKKGVAHYGSFVA
ncbi:MAG: hypothetical protein J0J06_13145 [Sphingomonas sp.]|uniref:hypothetical protein n=1 Tax=Sphingomonas sp. TaxID=28214 RepID=UPI001AD5D39F|nr:hypothetical protein [Sphingomonas sp.]MBN8816380.1 hypothetical protein [Sphingomonas sp.]